VALYGIILRNNLSHNADYTQMFSAPYRHIKTDAKFDSEEYKNLEQSAAMMGSFGYLLTSMQEEVDFVGGNAGTGFQSYDNLEDRCQKMISKLILGHSNAMDTKSTALGSSTAGKSITDEDSTPEGKAKLVIEKKQDSFLLNVLNGTVFPKFKTLGFPLNDEDSFYIENDKEEMELRRKNNVANQEVATVAKTMKDAGLQMGADYFESITGIPTTDAPVIEKTGQTDKTNTTAKLDLKLKNMYGKHKH